MISTCCTCVVSLVVRVISDAVLKLIELVHREVRDAIEDPVADDRGRSPVATFDEKKLLATAQAVPTSAISSIRPPIDQDLARVARDDAVVDDVGHQAGEIQVGQRLRQREHQDDGDQRPEWPEQREELQHGVPLDPLTAQAPVAGPGTIGPKSQQFLPAWPKLLQIRA